MTNGVTAYVLIQTAVNAAQVATEIGRIDGVESAEDVSGPYDVIVRASAADMDQLGQLVVTKIQTRRGHHPDPDLPDSHLLTTTPPPRVRVSPGYGGVKRALGEREGGRCGVRG